MTEMTGTCNWFDLPVADLADAMSFYEGLLGWKYQQMQDSVEKNYVMIQVGEKFIGGLRQTGVPQAGGGQPRGPIPYFTVDVLAEKIRKAKELGAELVGEKVDLGAGRGIYQWFRDRSGNLAALWAPQ